MKFVLKLVTLFPLVTVASSLNFYIYYAKYGKLCGLVKRRDGRFFQIPPILATFFDLQIRPKVATSISNLVTVSTTSCLSHLKEGIVVPFSVRAATAFIPASTAGFAEAPSGDNCLQLTAGEISLVRRLQNVCCFFKNLIMSSKFLGLSSKTFSRFFCRQYPSAGRWWTHHLPKRSSSQ